MNYKDIVIKFKETGEGFDIIYNTIHNSLKYFIYGYVKDFDIVNDIISQTMLIVYENIHKYDDTKSELNTWIFAIAKNECLTSLKKSKRTVSLNKKINDTEDEFLDIMDVNSDTNATTINEHKLQKVFVEIFNKIGHDTISGKILYLKYINKLSNVEIVNTINTPHQSEFEMLKTECDSNINNKVLYTELLRKKDNYFKTNMINESFVKNNLKRTEKTLINHFKDINIENILNFQNI